MMEKKGFFLAVGQDVSTQLIVTLQFSEFCEYVQITYKTNKKFIGFSKNGIPSDQEIFEHLELSDKSLLKSKLCWLNIVFRNNTITRLFHVFSTFYADQYIINLAQLTVDENLIASKGL